MEPIIPFEPIHPNALGQISTPLLWEEVLEGDAVGDLSRIMSKKNDFKKILHYFT